MSGVYLLDKQAVFRRLDDAMVAYQVDTGDTLVLGPLAARIVGLLSELPQALDVAQIAARLAAGEFTETPKSDLENTLEQAVSRRCHLLGLLQRCVRHT